MKISLIVAMACHRVIGHQNQLPWHLPADLQHFKRITLHKVVIMGRKTFDSIGRLLPERRNIILTRQADFQFEGAEVFHSLEQALSALNDEAEVMIIGGQAIFEQALPLANYLYVTYIDEEFVGDTYFPVWDEHEWQRVSEKTHAVDEKNRYPYRFVEYQRST